EPRHVPFHSILHWGRQQGQWSGIPAQEVYDQTAFADLACAAQQVPHHVVVIRIVHQAGEGVAHAVGYALQHLVPGHGISSLPPNDTAVEPRATGPLADYQTTSTAPSREAAVHYRLGPQRPSSSKRPLGLWAAPENCGG